MCEGETALERITRNIKYGPDLELAGPRIVFTRNRLEIGARISKARDYN